MSHVSYLPTLFKLLGIGPNQFPFFQTMPNGFLSNHFNNAPQKPEKATTANPTKEGVHTPVNEQTMLGYFYLEPETTAIKPIPSTQSPYKLKEGSLFLGAVQQFQNECCTFNTFHDVEVRVLEIKVTDEPRGPYVHSAYLFPVSSDCAECLIVVSEPTEVQLSGDISHPRPIYVGADCPVKGGYRAIIEVTLTNLEEGGDVILQASGSLHQLQYGPGGTVPPRS